MENELESLFSEVGDVAEVFMPTDRATGRPRGFAFIKFTKAEAAAEAIKKFDGHELQGRNIHVNEAQERPPRPISFPGSRPGGMPRGQKKFKPKGSRKNLRNRKRM